MANTDSFTALSNQMADAVDRTAAAVVQVRTRRWRPAAGVAFAKEYVLVSDHAVELEEDLSIRVDGRTLPAALAGRDPSTDLAVLKVAGLDVPALATSPGPARVGQMALAVGRSWSGGVVASLGVISSIGGPWRSGRGPAVEQVIRTDITTYPGFTGGALVGADGALVGVNTGILLRGLNLAIPSAIALASAQMLARHGSIRRAFLGVNGQPVRLPESQQSGGHERGILVVGVSDDSPARRAGLLVGDVLLTFNGHDVDDPETLLSLLTGDLIDRPVAVLILRGGTAQTVEVTLSERRPPAGR